jgi:hypothetical protein
MELAAGPWHNARRKSERLRLLREALASGNMTHAARALGVNRSHLYAILRKYTRELDDAVGGHDTVGKDNAVGLVGSVGATNSVGMEPAVGVTIADSLTYGERDRSFGRVSMEHLAAKEETQRVAFDLPRSCLEWLDREALRRKHAAGCGHAAKSPIVIDLIRQAMAEGSDE